MTVNGNTRSSAAPATVAPKAAARRWLPARAISVDEAWSPTGGQAFDNPRRHGGGRPKGLPTRVDPPGGGGAWKVNHLNTNTKGTTHALAVGVASRGLGSGARELQGLLVGVEGHGRADIGGPAVALPSARWACRRPLGRRHALPRALRAHVSGGPRRHAVALRPSHPLCQIVRLSGLDPLVEAVRRHPRAGRGAAAV